jgi:thiol-disulfide isomerase/thioredoxin
MEILIFTILIALLFFYFLNEKFDDNNTYDKKIILFYADWCGYCKRFIPIWEDLKLDEKLKNVKFINVDMSNEKKIITGDLNTSDLNLVNEVQINGFPTIKILHKGILTDYNNKREKEDIISFLTLLN